VSLLVVGLSHHTAGVPMLERTTLGADPRGKLLADLAGSAHVDEAAVLSTCNRVEVYADVARFHGGVAEVSDLLARHTGVALDELAPHLYVHYEDRAVQHLFEVAAGLDSMVVGEAQILGQVREALREAQLHATAGRALNDLLQRALRAGKRAHAETDIDRTGASLVAVALHLADGHLEGLAGRSAVVVGAGSMAALAAQSLRRAGVGAIAVANRTPDHAARVAAAVDGSGHPLEALPGLLDGADLVVSCVGATGYLLHADAVAAAQARRGARPLYLVDLALPRDIDPEVLAVAGASLVSLEDLADLLRDAAAPGGLDPEAEVEAVRAIVADEVAAHLAARHADAVAPVVVALRARADSVLAAELARLDARVELEPGARAEVEQALRRAVATLLHTPTVRVKELAAESAAGSYAEALHVLFDLDPAVLGRISRADLDPGAADPAAGPGEPS
jgi:glutamyl-tRNA reductase